MRIRKFNIRINKNALISHYKKINGSITNFDYLFTKYKDLPNKIEKTIIYDVYSKDFPLERKILDEYYNSAIIFAAIYDDIKSMQKDVDINTKNFLKAIEITMIEAMFDFSIKIIEDTNNIKPNLDIIQIGVDLEDAKKLLKLKNEDIENKIYDIKAVFWLKNKKKN
ncbi:MAG: hypothetical protein NZ870_02275 [bacterium]|nr:hypothetical protein [bacterium]